MLERDPELIQATKKDDEILFVLAKEHHKTGIRILRIEDFTDEVELPPSALNASAQRLVRRGFLRSAADQGSAYILEAAGLIRAEALASELRPLLQKAKDSLEFLIKLTGS